MRRLWRAIRANGRVAEPAPPFPARAGNGADADPGPGAEPETGAETTGAGTGTEKTEKAKKAGKAGKTEVRKALRGSLQIRHVDAGSCNGCEVEVGAAFGPVYDAERYGARQVASPRHADALMVTGVVTRNMAEPLRRTHAAIPAPKIVIAVGDCARNCGMFAGAYGVAGAVSDIVGVDAEVPGCPPRPGEIIAALREVTGT